VLAGDDAVIVMGRGEGVTLLEETRTTSSPIWSRRVVPAFSTTTFGPSTRDYNLEFRPSSVTSTLTKAWSPSWRCAFFVRIPQSYFCLYLVYET
jgi:hypothetical protein